MRVQILSLLAAWTMLATGEREPLIQGIGDAENAVFSDDGRLFVSGGANVYELTEQAGEVTAHALSAEPCNFTGLAVRTNYLYAVCVAGEPGSAPAYLMAAELTAKPELEQIHRFSIASVPNGISFASDGRLYIADSAAFAGSIVVVTLAPGYPGRVTGEQRWLSGFTFINGLRILGETFYLTDLNTIQSVPIRADGSPGPRRVLASSLTVFDDLLPSEQGLWVSDFLGNRLAHYSLEGKLLEQTDAIFESPSSVTAGRAPFGTADSLIVTEKGSIGELESDQGNRVSVYSP